MHTELRHQASEAGSPSPFCSLKEWDFLQILCISCDGLEEDCTTVSSCYWGYGNPRPGQQNCVRMLLPTQPSPTPPTLHCYCPEKAQAWVSDIAQQVKDLVVMLEDPGPTWWRETLTPESFPLTSTFTLCGTNTHTSARTHMHTHKRMHAHAHTRQYIYLI